MVSITFPDGHDDILILEHHHFSEEDRNAQQACHYIGQLKNDPEACVAMTGCPGSDDVEFTILSNHATESPMFKWTKQDTVEIIEHPYLVSHMLIYFLHFFRRPTTFWPCPYFSHPQIFGPHVITTDFLSPWL